MARTRGKGRRARAAFSGFTVSGRCTNPEFKSPRSNPQASLFATPAPDWGAVAWMGILLGGSPGCDREIKAVWKQCYLDGAGWYAWQHATHLDRYWRQIRRQIGGAR